ncbi:MAG: hypothetical protein MZV64_70000 [Ignavibacteriales bacterium]|nr:hypothetical protein [Ignavibacteriales bacterium]
MILIQFLHEALKEFKSVSKIIRLKRQNDTDVEKCLKYAISNKYDEALLVGVTGNRLDHTFCNLGIVLKFYPQINISLIAENSFLKAYSRKCGVKNFSRRNNFSLWYIVQKQKSTSQGLQV